MIGRIKAKYFVLFAIAVLLLVTVSQVRVRSRCSMASSGARLDLTRCGLRSLLLEAPLRAPLLDASWNAGLRELRVGAGGAAPGRLRVLFAAHCGFTGVPPHLARLRALHTVSFRGNRIERVHVRRLPSTLRALILTSNRIRAISAGNLPPHTTKIMLSNNNLTTLPTAWSSLPDLELIRLANNRLNTAAVTPLICDSPGLVWVALSSNPCSVEFALPKPNVKFQDIMLEKKLGEGTSGVVWVGTMKPGKQKYLIKIYKQADSSDGSVANEIGILHYVSQNPHANLPEISGTFLDPNGNVGVVSPFADFARLGDPPSLDSMTRDTYATEKRFSLRVALRVITDVARAASHLYSLGISHGDLYAHNVMYDPDTGHARLIDMGAAWKANSDRLRACMERREVRAWAILAEEVLGRVPESHDVKIPNVQSFGKVIEWVNSLE